MGKTSYPQIVKDIATITLMAMVILCMPTSTYAFDFKVRDFFQTKVEDSDRFIRNVNKKADQFVNISSGLITVLTRGGFSLLEKQTGLSTKNKVYKDLKNNTLKEVGFRLGVVEGTKDFVTGTVSLLAQLDSLPARTINLAYNVKEKPQAYKEKLTIGAQSIAGVLANPLPVLNGIYQMGKGSWAEAQKDPLKMGKLQGEIAVFGGTMLLGGGQVKGASAVNKAVNTAKTGALAKVAVPGKGINWGSLIPDFSQINIGIGRATPTLATTGKASGKLFEGYWSGSKAPYLTIKTEAVNIPSKVKPVSSSVSGMNGKSTVSEVVANRVSEGKYPLTWADFQVEWGLAERFPKSIASSIKGWADNKYHHWAMNLSKNAEGYLNSFTTNSKQMNNILRGIKKEASKKELADIDAVSKILQSAPPLDEEIILFRGMFKDGLGSIADLPVKRMIGKEFTEEGFMSTSLLPLKKFSSGIDMIIKAPKGTPGAYISEISVFPEEFEFVLGKGRKMKIRDVYPISMDEKLLLIVDIVK